MFHGSNVLRPQLKFEDTIDNSAAPFVPKVVSKPNAIIPLHEGWIAAGVTVIKQP